MYLIVCRLLFIIPIYHHSYGLLYLQLHLQGLTEQQAVQQYPKVRVYTKTFGSLRSTMEGSPLRSFVKLLVEDQGDKVVGCHMVGDDAPEIIQVGFGA
jgi:pyruvate/2-oxoglutarate dehydrogenase complex dihydrolipoamide dehydrogenase (E3) component